MAVTAAPSSSARRRMLSPSLPSRSTMASAASTTASVLRAGALDRAGTASYCNGVIEAWGGRVPMGPDERYVVISADCHGGGNLLDYRPYLASRWHDEFD